MIHTRETLLSALQRCMADENVSLRELSRRMGVTYDSLKDFKWGRTQMLRGFNLQKVVTYFGESYQPMIPILGMVGAGGEVRPIEDYMPGASMEEVECPPGADPSKVVALRIKGDSMHPVFQDGWIVYYSERIHVTAPAETPRRAKDFHGADILSSFYGKPCVVKLSDERVLLKTLKKGPGELFTLTSYNAPDMENVQLQWAARIVFVKIV